MSVFSKAFFPLVRSNFVSFSFFTARHNLNTFNNYYNSIFNFNLFFGFFPKGNTL